MTALTPNLTAMNRHETIIGGQQLAWYENDSSGHPVIFIHGNSLSWQSFLKQFNSPLAEKYRLIAIDLPGHGASALALNPDTTYSLPGYAALLSAFTRQLDIEDAVMVGWSLGGHILLEAANSLDRVAGFMIFGTPPIGKPMAADAFKPHSLGHLLFTSDLCKEDAANLVASYFSSDRQAPGIFTEAIMKTDGRARALLLQSLLEGNYSDEVALVGNLARPLAIIHGEADQFVNPAYIQQLQIPTLWRGATQVIADAGHAPQWEQPERFNRLLEEFATECLATLTRQIN